MKRIIMFVLLFAALKVAGQTTGYFRFDTVRIMKQNGTCELYLINKTKDSLGLLTNVGGGLTQFRKSKMLNDSTVIIGLDTLVVPGNIGATQLTDSSFIVGNDTITIRGTGGSGIDTIQVHTSGTTVAVSTGVNILYIDPASTLATLTITLPATPNHRGTLDIFFGGTLTSGNVVTAITISPNGGQTKLEASTPGYVEAGEHISYQYRVDNTKWYRKH